MTLQKLGRYEIVGELGKGAMGQVYLAKDPLIGRQLALKTFRLGFSAKDADRAQFKARFLREAQSAGILSHPNIVTIHDVVEDQSGDFFIAMEYVKGTDLKQLMQRQGRLDVKFVLDIIAQIADGLDYAHQKGVIHRDIKPANIILTADKQAKITDFGIARVEQSNLTVEGQLLGTPNYMAPEQIQGREVDHRADLFSLGVMLYEMVTGKKPFQGDNLTMVTHRIVYDAFTPPSQLVAGLPDRLGAVLDKALEKDANRRYASGSEMARDLRAVFKAPSAGAEGGTASFLAPPQPPAPVADGTGAMPQAPTPGGRAPYPLNTSSSGAFATGTLTGQSVVMAPPEEEEEGGGKGLIIGVVVAVLIAVAAGAFFLLRPSETEPAAAIDPMAEVESQYKPLVDKGQEALAAGEAVQAIEYFDQALVFVPGDREIRRLREEAERMLQDEGLTLEEAQARAQLRQGDAALVAKEYDRAIELAQAVLAFDAESEEAAALLESAQDGLAREQEAKKRVKDRFTRQPVADGGGATPTREGSDRTTAAAETQKATLEIDFFSEVSEGLLRVFHGGDRVVDENFTFVEKGSGVFARERKTSGRLNRSAEVTAGTHRMRVYVYADGTKSAEVDGTFDPGQTHVLRIEVDKDGAVSVRFE